MKINCVELKLYKRTKDFHLLVYAFKNIYFDGASQNMYFYYCFTELFQNSNKERKNQNLQEILMLLSSDISIMCPSVTSVLCDIKYLSYCQILWFQQTPNLGNITLINMAEKRLGGGG